MNDEIKISLREFVFYAPCTKRTLVCGVNIGSGVRVRIRVRVRVWLLGVPSYNTPCTFYAGA